MAGLLKSVERKIRRARNRILQRGSEFPDINHLLHELRGQAFSRLDFQAEHLVSVGCADTWYFDWVEERFGPVAKHTGVEFYAPQPADLPANCQWIANTAGNMPEIGDTCADAVFSGQNLEHLWPEEVIGFFLESYRILKPGGHLVVDSPNRNVTSRLQWSHPEHTVELTTDEAMELCEISGFDVEKSEGIWLCIDPDNDQLLPFGRMSQFASWPMSERMNQGTSKPQDCFIWWVVASKSSRLPDTEKLKQRMAEIFEQAWPERCERTKTIIGSPSKQRPDWLASRGKPGVLMAGPYLPVKKGQYSARFQLRFTGAGSSTEAGVTCEVLAGTKETVLETRRVTVKEQGTNGEFAVEIPFSVEDTTFGIQFRVLAEQNAPVECESKATLDGWQQW